MVGERKKYAMTARRSVKHPNLLLSNTVMVEEGKDRYTCTISFSEDLVHFVGKKLPRGLATFDPAFLVVSQQIDRTWRVQACYVRDSVSVVLWACAERPTWLKPING